MEVGLSAAKASYIKGFAEHIKKNPDYFDEIDVLDDTSVITRLTIIRGIALGQQKCI